MLCLIYKTQLCLCTRLLQNYTYTSGYTSKHCFHTCDWTTTLSEQQYSQTLTNSCFFFAFPVFSCSWPLLVSSQLQKQTLFNLLRVPANKSFHSILFTYQLHDFTMVWICVKFGKSDIWTDIYNIQTAVFLEREKHWVHCI